MVAIKSLFPGASREDLTEEMLDVSLKQLRRCFGPNNNNKKKNKD
jgi:hypothetical protein